MDYKTKKSFQTAFANLATQLELVSPTNVSLTGNQPFQESLEQAEIAFRSIKPEDHAASVGGVFDSYKTADLILERIHTVQWYVEHCLDKTEYGTVSERLQEIKILLKQLNQHLVGNDK